MASRIIVMGLRNPRDGHRNSTVSTATTTAANIQPSVSARNENARASSTLNRPSTMTPASVSVHSAIGTLSR